MGKVFYMRKGETHTTPVTGIVLADMAEGSIVKLNENGSSVEFYVAKHNYESGLNGNGRTLLVRKDCYDKRVWNATSHSVGTPKDSYVASDINNWLHNTYVKLFSSEVQNFIGTTKFYGCNNDTPITLDRSAFLLSITELGVKANYAPVEGSLLPTASILRIAYFNGVAVDQWTRTPTTKAVGYAYPVSKTGGLGEYAYEAEYDSCSSSQASRPCFTFPSNALFDAKTLVFKGVA